MPVIRTSRVGTSAIVAAMLLSAIPHVVAAAIPDFKLPFVCGQSYTGSTHPGHGWAIDFNQPRNADKGDPVLASAAGTVTETKYVASNGQITITHGGGWQTWYAHMRGVVVKLHQEVRQGQLLGRISHVGNATLDHLHFEEDLNGERVRSRFDGVPYRYGTRVKSTNSCSPSQSDSTPPSRTAPIAQFTVGKALRLSRRSVPVTQSWTVSDAGSGVDHSVLQRRKNHDPYNRLLTTGDAPSPTHTFYVAPSATSTWTHRVRATDAAGNVSSYARGPTYRVRIRQDDDSSDVSFTGTDWASIVDATTYSGGSVRAASAAGSNALLEVSAHDFAIVATKGPDMGMFEVYVDGVADGVVDLYRSVTSFRRIVWEHHFASSEPHVVELRLLGTGNTASAGTKVELDAFLILQP